MVDTPRTLAELLGTTFADGQVGGITAQDVRDLIVSLATPINAGGLDGAALPWASESATFVSAWTMGGYAATAPTSSVGNSEDRMNLSPFPIQRPITVDAMAVVVIGANSGVGAVARLGLYDADPATGLAGDLVFEAGTVAITTTGAKIVTLAAPELLSPGMYWAAIACQGLDTGDVNPTFHGGTAASSVNVGAWGTSLPVGNTFYVRTEQASVPGALPATATPGVPSIQNNNNGILRSWLRIE